MALKSWSSDERQILLTCVCSSFPLSVWLSVSVFLSVCPSIRAYFNVCHCCCSQSCCRHGQASIVTLQLFAALMSVDANCCCCCPGTILQSIKWIHILSFSMLHVPLVQTSNPGDFLGMSQHAQDINHGKHKPSKDVWYSFRLWGKVCK